MREADKLNKKTMFAWIDYLAIVANPKNTIDKLTLLDFNTLFILGDENCCFIKGTKTVFQKLHHANMKLIHHCSHVCSIERYKEFNNWTLAYLQGTPKIIAA